MRPAPPRAPPASRSAAAVAVLLMIATAVTLAGCHTHGGRAKVVATIFPVYDLARRVAGPDADVELLVPPGARPETRPQDVEARANGARLGILIGADYDAWLLPVMKQVAPSARVLKLGDRVPTLPPRTVGAPGIDPHVWLDPARALLMARAIVDDLCRVDPAHAMGYRTRGVALTQALEALDRELEARTATWTTRAITTRDDDYRYFAERYHLDSRIAPDATAAVDPLGGAPGEESYEALLRADADGLGKEVSGGGAPNGPAH